jgi:RNA polymerase sigma factor (sigma-70 family)
VPGEPVPTDAGGLAPEAAGALVGTLFDRHGRLVYGICRLILRDSEEAEDATQQTFLSAHKSLLRGTRPRDAGAWLATIARNESRSRIRARMREPIFHPGEPQRPGGPVDDVNSRLEEVAALFEALRQLPRPQRDAIVLRELYGLSHREVAVALGVSSAAVDGLLVRARRRLQIDLRPARAAVGALVVPIGLRESLAHALPGFAGAGGSGLLGKLGSMAVAGKLAAAAVTVTVCGTLAVTTLERPRAADPTPQPHPSVDATRPSDPAHVEHAELVAARPDAAPSAPSRRPARTEGADGDAAGPAREAEDEDLEAGDGAEPEGGILQPEDEVEPAAEREAGTASDVDEADEAGAASDVDEDDEVAGEPETQGGPDSEDQPGDLPAEYMDD